MPLKPHSKLFLVITTMINTMDTFIFNDSASTIPSTEYTFEGARGTYRKVFNLINCTVTMVGKQNTTYGWEANLLIKANNDFEEWSYEVKGDGVNGSYHKKYIFKPKMFYFRYLVKGWLNAQAVKVADTDRQQAVNKAWDIATNTAADESNIAAFNEIDKEEYNAIIASW